jgi:hypothetical protein
MLGPFIVSDNDDDDDEQDEALMLSAVIQKSLQTARTDSAAAGDAGPSWLPSISDDGELSGILSEAATHSNDEDTRHEIELLLARREARRKANEERRANRREELLMVRKLGRSLTKVHITSFESPPPPYERHACRPRKVLSCCTDITPNSETCGEISKRMSMSSSRRKLSSRRT